VAISAGSKVNCQKCGESFDLAFDLLATDPGETKQVTPATVPGKWVTLGAVLGVMGTMAVLALCFALATQAFRRQKDLPPPRDPGELVGLVAGGADLVIKIDGEWTRKNKLDSLLKPSGLGFLADPVEQIPKALDLGDYRAMAVGVPFSAPFSLKIAVETGHPWRANQLEKSLEPTLMGGGTITRVKGKGWPISLDLLAPNDKQVVAMLGTTTQESRLNDFHSKSQGMALSLQEMVAARIPLEAPVWLVAKKPVSTPEEGKSQKTLLGLEPNNPWSRWLNSDWTVLGAWVESYEGEQGNALPDPSQISLRLEVAFGSEESAGKWEKEMEQEKWQGWKSVREGKVVSVQWKGALKLR